MLSQQSYGTDALLQAASSVNDEIVWVSGHQATYGRTSDGGSTWTTSVMPDAEELQFRDVAAFNEWTAYLMSAGSSALLWIYRADDGGRNWAADWSVAALSVEIDHEV